MTCNCGRPTNGGFLCSSCTKALEIALGNISSYWADLDTVKGRQTRYGGLGGRMGAEKPLPVDARFLGAYEDGSILQDAVKNTISTWTRIVMEEKPVLHGPVHPACLHVTCSTVRRSWWPADTVGSCCRYLLGHADWMRTKEWAPEILDELDNLELQLRRMVDRPADKLFVGYCTECELALHAKIGALQAKCTACEKVFSVEASREGMWVEAQDQLGTAAEISRAISWLGQTPITADRIYKWVERKRLTQRGHVIYRGREVPIYRIGDVAALVQASENQKQAG
jgi:hypothetical protein